MKILALELSSAQRSVAVVQTAAQGTISVTEVVEARAQPSMRPLGMVEEALQRAGLEREQIEVLAIGLGPGSYTGIRAGIALAQGWQLAREVKLLGINSAECIAAEAHTEGIRGGITVAIDAQRKELYLADYELSDSGWREIRSLHLAGREAATAAVAAGRLLVGPEAPSWSATGRIVFPRAAVTGTLAVVRKDFLPGEGLEPIYLRATTFVKAPPPRLIPPPG